MHSVPPTFSVASRASSSDFPPRSEGPEGDPNKVQTLWEKYKPEFSAGAVTPSIAVTGVIIIGSYPLFSAAVIVAAAGGVMGGPLVVQLMRRLFGRSLVPVDSKAAYDALQTEDKEWLNDLRVQFSTLEQKMKQLEERVKRDRCFSCNTFQEWLETQGVRKSLEADLLVLEKGFNTLSGVLEERFEKLEGDYVLVHASLATADRDMVLAAKPLMEELRALQQQGSTLRKRIEKSMGVSHLSRIFHEELVSTLLGVFASPLVAGTLTSKGEEVCQLAQDVFKMAFAEWETRLYSEKFIRENCIDREQAFGAFVEEFYGVLGRYKENKALVLQETNWIRLRIQQDPSEGWSVIEENAFSDLATCLPPGENLSVLHSAQAALQVRRTVCKRVLVEPETSRHFLSALESFWRDTSVKPALISYIESKKCEIYALRFIAVFARTLQSLQEAIDEIRACMDEVEGYSGPKPFAKGETYLSDVQNPERRRPVQSGSTRKTVSFQEKAEEGSARPRVLRCASFQRWYERQKIAEDWKTRLNVLLTHEKTLALEHDITSLLELEREALEQEVRKLFTDMGGEPLSLDLRGLLRNLQNSLRSCKEDISMLIESLQRCPNTEDLKEMFYRQLKEMGASRDKHLFEMDKALLLFISSVFNSELSRWLDSLQSGGVLEIHFSQLEDRVMRVLNSYRQNQELSFDKSQLIEIDTLGEKEYGGGTIRRVFSGGWMEYKPEEIPLNLPEGPNLECFDATEDKGRLYVRTLGTTRGGECIKRALVQLFRDPDLKKYVEECALAHIGCRREDVISMHSTDGAAF